MVLEWLPGRTLSNETCLEPGMPERVASALRQLHGGPRFRDDFDMVDLSARYLAVVDERRIRVPAGYRTHLSVVPRIAAALAARPTVTVPCHNDLLPPTTSTTGRGCGSSTTNTAATATRPSSSATPAQELGWDDARIEALCAAYFGQASDVLLARMRLQMIMSDVGWTLWAAIQAAVSTIDYDFWGWAEERWARAAAPWMA
jgi:thiamine kinase-like enzyme